MKEKYRQLQECEPGWVCPGLGRGGWESFPEKLTFELKDSPKNTLYSATLTPVSVSQTGSRMIHKLENGAHIQ